LARSRVCIVELFFKVSSCASDSRATLLHDSRERPGTRYGSSGFAVSQIACVCAGAKPLHRDAPPVDTIRCARVRMKIALPPPGTPDTRSQ